MKNDHYRKMKKDALAGLARKKRKGKISPGLETQRKCSGISKLYNHVRINFYQPKSN